jgi:hypothetical protein
MADSVRLAIQKQLSSYLSTEVTVANGYQHTLTDAVFRGRFWFGDDDPLPMISILETLNPDREPVRVGNARGVQKDDWILLVQGWAREEFDNPTDSAHALMVDVKKALGKLRKQVYDTALKGTAFEEVVELALEPGTVRPPDQLSERAFFWLRIVLTVTEDGDALFWPP